jgi:hypothetical protein
MTNEETAPTTSCAIRFFWWCRQCGWWSEVDFGGLCSTCRAESDDKDRGATTEDKERLSACRRCLV